MKLLAKLAVNKQATWSVVAMLALEVILQIAVLWFPEGITDKVYETCRILNKVAVGYAVIMTANHPKDPPSESP